MYLVRWNQLDLGIVLLSIAGIILEEMDTGIIPINPTIIRVMRVLRIARGLSSRLTSLANVKLPLKNCRSFLNNLLKSVDGFVRSCYT